MSPSTEEYYHTAVVRPPALPFDEEQAMFADYRRRRTARRRERIVRQFLYWSAELACRYCGPRMPKADAISAANLGLMQAIEGFDHRLGRRFVTYSYFVIRRTVLEALRSSYVVNPAPGLQHPRYVFAKSERTRQDREEFDAAKAKVFDGLGQTTHISLDESSDGSGVDYEDDASESRSGFENESSLQFLKSKLHVLNKLEREVIERRYLTDRQPTFEKIGRDLKIPKSNVRYRHRCALAKLKRALRKEI